MAEAFSHSKAIKDKMSQLANVTTQAETRITAQILSVAAKELSETAGTDLYDDVYRDWETDRKSTRLNSSHITRSRMPSSA